ncbi:MAG TPA: GWxTD domain-containing protein, partial [Candidatus Syntrophosphaera sp.]|nr:GWxTD domain-containing protein [Candidatus Syntrophosphaera sp.]
QPEQRGESGLLILTIQKDSLIVSDEYLDFTPQSDSEGITLRIPLAELKPGRYDGDLEFQLGDRSETREFVFFVTEPREDQYFVFPDPDQEFQLLRYFLGSNLPTNWKSYSEEAKRRYITLAWKNYAQSNDTSPQAMLDTVRGRVEYANRYYGHFDPGWTSDRGRIHIRNGKPDEIESSTTSDETRYVRKDYQIWKYRGRINAVYLFLDMQMNGNYKLIYVNNDDNENSHPDYMRYLGDDFDTSELSN